MGKQNDETKARDASAVNAMVRCFYSMKNCYKGSTHICDEDENPLCGTKMERLKKHKKVKIENLEIFELWNNLGEHKWVRTSKFEFCKSCYRIFKSKNT